MNKKILIAVAIFFVIGFILGTQMRGCRRGPLTEIKSVRSDTVMRYVDRTDTLYKSIAVYKPAPVKVMTLTDSQLPSRNISSDCFPTDSAFYSDSIYRAREFKAVINDIITGNRIASRSILWADLTPITETTITKTVTIEKKQPVIKVYLGANAGVRYETPLTRGGLDIAPAASVILSDRYMVDVGYYILGGEITAGLKVKLSFKK